jgi:hypothetical protein
MTVPSGLYHQLSRQAAEVSGVSQRFAKRLRLFLRRIVSMAGEKGKRP